MHTIKKVDDYTFGVGVNLFITASIKPFQGATETKTVTLKIDLSNLPLKDLCGHAAEQIRIKWANGANGRKKFSTIEDRSTITVDAKAPGAEVKTEAELIAEAEAVLGNRKLAEMMIREPEKFQALMKQIDTTKATE